MERHGGINFTVLHPGGYRKKADSLVTISSEKLILAIVIIVAEIIAPIKDKY